MDAAGKKGDEPTLRKDIGGFPEELIAAPAGKNALLAQHQWQSRAQVSIKTGGRVQVLRCAPYVRVESRAGLADERRAILRRTYVFDSLGMAIGGSGVRR